MNVTKKQNKTNKIGGRRKSKKKGGMREKKGGREGGNKEARRVWQRRIRDG